MKLESRKTKAIDTSGQWLDGEVPPNVQLGSDTIIKGEQAFLRFHSQLRPALLIGDHSTMDGVHFALGQQAKMSIGDYCFFSCAILLCEQELRIGNYVVIGWNTTIADTDFHPISPDARIQDAIACSPLGNHHARPQVL